MHNAWGVSGASAAIVQRPRSEATIAAQTIDTLPMGAVS
jgi:hypothetical protein